MFKVNFDDVTIGKKFAYKGVTFVKATSKSAWELRGAIRYKEWVFMNDDQVIEVR
jgi:hypothetical protein